MWIVKTKQKFEYFFLVDYLSNSNKNQKKKQKYVII